MKLSYRFLMICLLMTAISCSTFERKPTGQSESLEGRKFCREVKVSAGLFGQPAGLRQHCVEFKDGKIFDNKNKIFGNSPARDIVPYTFIMQDDSQEEVRGDVEVNFKVVYRLRGEVLLNEAGAELFEVIDLR